jgi:hypothetical protein
MSKQNEQTVAQLKSQLTKLGVKFPKKAPRAKLLALLNAAEQAQQSAAPMTKKPRRSVKAQIRAMFPSVGTKVAVEALFAAFASVKQNTVATILSDLKNPNYCGAGGVVDIKRDGDMFVRIL